MMMKVAIEKKQQLIKAVIFGDDDFLGHNFWKKLEAGGVKVVWEKDWQEGEKLDYGVVMVKEKLTEFLIKWRGKKQEGTKWLVLSALEEEAGKLEKIFADWVKKEGVDARLVFFRDVYGPEMKFEEKTEFGEFLRRAAGGELVVEGDGLEKCWPTFGADLVEGALRALFFQNTRGKVFFISETEELTLINLAYLLAKLGPERWQIKFKPRERRRQNFWSRALALESSRYLGWEPKVGLEEGLRRTMAWFKEKRRDELWVMGGGFGVGSVDGRGGEDESRERVADKKLRQKKRESKLEKLKRFFWGRKVFCWKRLIPLFLILLILYPFLSFGWNLGWGFVNLKQGAGFLKKGNLSGTQKKIESSGRHLITAKKQLSGWWLISRLPWGENLYQTETVIDLGINLADSGRQMVEAAENFEGAWKQIVGEESQLSLREALAKSSRDLSEAGEKLSLVETNWQALSQETKKIVRLFFKIDGGVEGMAIRQKINFAARLLPTLEKVLGGEQKKVYLVLFQNNMELRATGGFIGSFGLLTFEKGKLTDFKVHDVYEADGQLKGHVEPPKPLRIYLGEPGWYLRDSNWDPDFYQSALNAAWFLEKEMKISVNGVIGVNLNAAENFLAELGPIQLPDYQEEINQKNLFLTAEKYAEKESFAGSTQKKDFLGALGRQLFERIKTGKEEEKVKILKALWKSLEERQILLSLDEKEAMVLVNEVRWDGDLRRPDCRKMGILQIGDGCWADETVLVEANLGVNKANYFVKRKVTQEITLKEEEVLRTVEINYENGSPDNQWPGGSYRNYLRVMVPAKARLEEVAIDGRGVEEAKIDKEIKNEKAIFGFLVEVGPGEKRKVRLRYSLPVAGVGGKWSYFLWLPKQSGIGADPLEISGSFPENWELKGLKPSGLTGRQTIVYNTDLSLDRFLILEFERMNGQEN